MNRAATAPAPGEDAAPIRWAAALLLAAALLVYGDSLSGEFVFDDIASIPKNPTLHHLWPPSAPLSPPNDSGLTVNGRPLLNLSFALNYAVGRNAVLGYHVVNLAIHLGAALLLLGIARRTFLRPLLAPRYGPRALYLGAATALLWMVHPMQTEAVTYMVQRAESLMGFFYLLTLYAFVRAVETEEAGGRPLRWYLLSVAACLLGMGVKEVMATAPAMVFLYDRTFVAGTFREAWRRRRGYYLALAAAWLLLGWLMVGSGERGGTAGFGISIPWYVYGLRQFQSIVDYLRVIAWPHPLIFNLSHHNTFGDLSTNLWEVVPSALLVIPLLAATAWAVWRRPAAGFLGAWFFVILSPSSSIVPVCDLYWDHRIYLSLAAPVALAVAGLERGLGRRSWLPLAFLAAAWGALSAWRNQDYRTPLVLWTQTLAAQPENAANHNNLGMAYMQSHRYAEAEAELGEAIRLNPYLAVAYANLGDVYLQTGRIEAAVGELRRALQLRPAYPEAYTILGNASLRAGRAGEAEQDFAEAIRLKPRLGPAHYEMGNLRLQQGRAAEAAAEYRTVLAGSPDDARAHNSLGVALAQLNRLPEAQAEIRAALALAPDNPNAHYNLGTTLLVAGRPAEAAAEFRETLRLSPGHAQARAALARLEPGP